MRVSLLLTLIVVGCSRPEGRGLDGLLATNRIDRIEVVDDDHDRTNVLTEAATARLLDRLAATNRRPDPLRHKSYTSGTVWLYSGGQRIDGLAYFPREQVLQYRRYEFTLRDTNDIASLFK